MSSPSDRKASFEAVSQTLADDVTELHHALLECLSTGVSTALHLEIESVSATFSTDRAALIFQTVVAISSSHHAVYQAETRATEPDNRKAAPAARQ